MQQEHELAIPEQLTLQYSLLGNGGVLASVVEMPWLSTAAATREDAREQIIDLVNLVATVRLYR